MYKKVLYRYIKLYKLMKVILGGLKKPSWYKKQCPLVGNSPKNVSYNQICFFNEINRGILVYFIKFLVNMANVLGKPRTFAILTSNLMK